MAGLWFKVGVRYATAHYAAAVGSVCTCSPTVYKEFLSESRDTAPVLAARRGSWVEDTFEFINAF